MIDTDKPESAFPSTFKSLHPDEAQVHRWGMTLRDYFAAKAMQSLMRQYPEHLMISPANAVASDAYVLADAMLEARKA